MRANYKPVNPDKLRREMQREFKGFAKEEPGPERAERLAAFTRAAHAERQLNMAMHTGALCLDDDPDAPALLIAAYEDDDADPEAQLRLWTDLQDLARYLERPDIGEVATKRIREGAEQWVREVDEQEHRHVLRTLANIVDRAFADDVKDTVRFG